MSDDAWQTAVDEHEARLAADPQQLADWLGLIALYRAGQAWPKADDALARGYAAVQGDLAAQEALETAQIEVRRDEVAAARAELDRTGSSEQRTAYQYLADDLLEIEIEYYQLRVQRYPDVLMHQFELAKRMQTAGAFIQAIAWFEESLGEEACRPAALLELVDCYAQLQHFSKAEEYVQAAIVAVAGGDLEPQKRAYFLAARLAMMMNDADAAREYLGRLNTLSGGD